ncbi:MAG: lipocalin family protein [Proteobacteria bacterium]|nr:lipocalin family protein [Pseudomonadota bacterium]MBU1688592.1 lipocalin family protein [Pseudomonadota bacterium]
MKNLSPLTIVDKVDLSRYLGNWYEIARYPNRFQKGCLKSRATYAMREDGRIAVINECTDEKTGKLRQAKGKAWVVDTTTNAKLKVSFFWPFSGDYWIVELGRDYEYAVIGHPKRTYLWILSRETVMGDDLFDAIVSRLAKQGYDPSRLIRTDHS